MISKEELVRIGNLKGLKNREHTEKIYFQDIFLFNLYKKTNIFVFKGGTALYKFYNLPRFSEDLDFSLSDKMKSENVEETINEIVSGITGFSVKSIKRMKDSFLIKISVNGILTDYNTLRVDVSLKNEILEACDIKNYISEYIDIPPFSLKILKPEEIISEKIHSLFSRYKARDLYDLFFLLRQFKFNKKLTENKLKIFNIKFSKSILKKRINNLKPLWGKELKPFVLEKLPEFNLVRDYVFKKIGIKE